MEVRCMTEARTKLSSASAARAWQRAVSPQNPSIPTSKLGSSAGLREFIYNPCRNNFAISMIKIQIMSKVFENFFFRDISFIKYIQMICTINGEKLYIIRVM